MHKLKEAVYKSCGECGVRKETISDEVWGCDTCKKAIDLNESLEVQSFEHTERTQTYRFCGWECALRKVLKLKVKYLVTLPHLSNDRGKGRTAKDFLRILRKGLSK